MVLVVLIMQEKSLIEKGENAMEERKLVETGKWALINYFDVLGNEQSGWEVNNQSVELSGITIVEDATNNDIIEYLVKQGFLLQTCTVDDFYILWETDFIEIFAKSNGQPLYCFRKEYEYK